MGSFNQVPLKQELFFRDQFRWSDAQQKHIETYDDIYERDTWINIIVGKESFRERNIDYFNDRQDINEDLYLFISAGGKYKDDILAIFAELILLLERCEILEFYELASNINYIITLIGNAIKHHKEQEDVCYTSPINNELDNLLF